MSSSICKIKHPTIQDILAYPIILTEKDASYRRLLEEKLHEDNLEIKPFIQSKNTDLLLELLKLDPIYQFLPKYILENDLKIKQSFKLIFLITKLMSIVNFFVIKISGFLMK